MALHRNQTIKNEIAKRNSKVKSRYLSKTMSRKTKYGISRPVSAHSIRIRDPLTSIRLKHGSLTASSAQNDIKIKIGTAMNQLNDLDSRSVGLSLLHNIINNIPDKLLHLVIEPFYAINNDLKALCRKELALLIGYIASKKGNTILFYKYLNKLCVSLSKRAQDCDSRVKEACGDSFGRMTMQCVRFTSSSNNNEISKCNEIISKIMKPIIKNIEKGISPHSISGNFICLSNVILAADAQLTMDHIVIICKCIVSNIINIRDAKTHVSLLFCIEKLMMVAAPLISNTENNNNNNNNTDYFCALLAIIMDGFENKDWSVRNHALKAIHIVGVIFANIEDKAQIDNNRNEIIAHLERLKYDKISNVRNNAIMTIAVWNDIDNEIKRNKEINLNENENENISDDLEEEEMIEEQPWFDKNDKKDIKVIMDTNSNNNKEEKECDDNCNALLLQQQQLMLKTIKNLESYIHREISNIKSRVHSVERDVQRMKVLQQNEEWINDNKTLPNNNINDAETIIANTMIMDNESKEDSDKTKSIYSDDTQIVNLNEELLNIIQMDNNTKFIQWLMQHKNCQLFEIIDERLMISLIYRITQLLKNKKYINDIGEFLKKEFVIGVDTVPKAFILPQQLKTEFLNTINQYENMKHYVDHIKKII